MSSSQHGVLKSKSCLSNLISFSDRETDLVWMEIVGPICLKFYKILTLFQKAFSKTS